MGRAQQAQVREDFHTKLARLRRELYGDKPAKPLWRILSEAGEDSGRWEGETPEEAFDAFARFCGEKSGSALAKSIGMEYGDLLAAVTIQPTEPIRDLGWSDAPRYRTDEMPEGTTCTLRELIDGNRESPETVLDVCQLRVGESTCGVVSVTRVA